MEEAGETGSKAERRLWLGSRAPPAADEAKADEAGETSDASGSVAARRLSQMEWCCPQAAEEGERATKKLAVLTDPYNTLIKQSRLRKVDIVAAAFSLHIL